MLALVDIKTQQYHLLEELAAYRTKIRQQISNYAQLIAPDTITVAQMQDFLQNQEALIEYVQGVDRFYALILTKTTYQVIPLDSIEIIRQQVGIFNKSIRQMGKDKKTAIDAHITYLKSANFLYQSLIAPIQQTGLIADKQLIIMPSDSLFRLSFKALISDTLQKAYDDYHYLIKDHVISYYPSSMTLYYERKKGKQPLWKAICLKIPIERY